MSHTTVEQIVREFRKGGVVIFPTDTVWGIGAIADREDAIRRMYSVKRREENKPTAILVDGLSMAAQYGIIRGRAKRLAEKYWPGGLTMIVPARKGKVAGIVSGGTDAVGLRVPKHDFLLSVLEKLGCGIVAGSANFAGGRTPLRFADIDKKLLKAVDFVARPRDEFSALFLGAGCKLPSTVLDTTKRPFVILRKGPVKLKKERGDKVICFLEFGIIFSTIGLLWH